MKRKGKQITIFLIFLLFVAIFFAIVYFTFFHQKASCSDGKQNQDERGIDCGGACSQYCLADYTSNPVQVSEVQVLPYTDTSSDVIGTVSNANSKAALKKADFIFTIYDETGATLAEERGQVSLLPLESRTLSALGIELNSSISARAELRLENEEWEVMEDYVEPPQINIANQQFILLSDESGFAEARGLVQNQSPYDIRSLGITVIPRDENGRALSVNKTILNTLQSGEKRDFRLVWPQDFVGSPVRADMEIHFDFLAEDAFVQQFFETPNESGFGRGR